MTELYRLQNGQQISDLKSEHIDSLELGWRLVNENVQAEVAAYAMRKRNSVFRDAQGFNVSGARSRHRGIETAVTWQPLDRWKVSMNASYAIHKYDFNFTPARGEQFVAGNDMDSAPRFMGSLTLNRKLSDKLRLDLQWVKLGSYFLDAGNSSRYRGHSLLNLRAMREITSRFDLAVRVNNLLDTAFADRADFASGQYRYFPGRGRELFVELRYTAKSQTGE